MTITTNNYLISKNDSVALLEIGLSAGCILVMTTFALSMKFINNVKLFFFCCDDNALTSNYFVDLFNAHVLHV